MDHKYFANILVVDDNRVDSALLEEILKSFGCVVTVSTDIDITNNFQSEYDIIFVDINMPTISGFSMSKSIKTGNSKFARNIIAVSSTKIDQALMHKCKENKIDGFLEKPPSKKVVLEVLEEFVSDKKIKSLMDENDQLKGFMCINDNKIA